MFSGFPDVGVVRSPLPNIADPKVDPLAEAEAKRPDGSVMRLTFPSVTEVVIDAHAVLRIVKHARDHGTRIVNGSLTGLQFGTVGEITNAIPYVASADAEDEGKRDREDHQALIQRYGSAGMDRFPVGRYICSAHGAHLSSRQVSHLESCVRSGEPSLLLAYDPIRSAMGKLYLKAYVLSDTYLNMIREELDALKRPDSETAAEERRNRVRHLDGEGLLKEVPVRINANVLQLQLLASLASKPRPVRNDIIANHDLGRYMERNMHNAVEVLERLRTDVNHRVARHREDGALPLRPETHILAQQLKEQAAHLHALAAGSALNLDFARRVAP